jgi:signal transduction histidine kinase
VSGTQRRVESSFRMRALRLVLPEERPDDLTGDASRARLLAALSLWLVGLCVLGCIQTALLAPASLRASVIAAVAATGSVFALVYAAARAGHPRIAGAVTVAAQIAGSVGTFLLYGGERLPGSSSAGWLVLGLLTTNGLFGPRAVLGVGTLSTLLVIGTEAWAGTPAQTVAEGALLLVAVTMALFVYTRHRDRLEAARREVLRARNEELEELRSSLEARVQRRTAALARSTAELRSSYDSLAKNQALLVRTEKMAAVGRLTAGFAHEMATPLSAVLAATALSLDLSDEYARSIGDPQVLPEDHREIAAEMKRAAELTREAAERAVTFVRGMRAHTRDPGPMAVETFDVNRVVREASTLVACVARSRKVELTVVESSEPACVVGVPSRLNQVITNLVQNAVDATSETGRGGHVVVRVSADARGTTVRVEDDGPGIPADVLPRIFEPMFTTKAYGKGTGLGLSIVAEIVRGEMSGEVLVETSEGKGTTFVVHIPTHEGRHGA